MDHDPSRRDFLAASRSALGGAWLVRFAPLVAATQACAADARRAGLPFATFTDREGADFDAFAARIVPTDDTPGAREAGAVHFADRALGTFFADVLPVIRGGLRLMNERASQSLEGDATFADLDERAQDQLIAAIEEEAPDFFYFARTLVVMSLVADPEHGGNRDQIGWRLIGFEDRFVYQPPFGYYDRDEHGAAPSGGGDA